MCLDTLNGVKQIGEFGLINMHELKELYPERFNRINPDTGQTEDWMDWEWFEKEIRPNYFIYYRPDKHSLSFTLQEGPIKDNGVNGCQVDSLIESAKIIIEKLNEKFPCSENESVITCLENALGYLIMRKKDRINRGVEGTNQV